MLLLLILLFAFDLSGPLRSGGDNGENPKGGAQGCAPFSAATGCRVRKSHWLREPAAQLRARRRGVLSFGYFSLHKQRKVTRQGRKLPPSWLLPKATSLDPRLRGDDGRKMAENDQAVSKTLGS
ncbi:MAG: hypothetical protein ABN502_06420, partial [Gammaproteobacteria bacterium]